jgi:hypothetical protein
MRRPACDLATSRVARRAAAFSANKNRAPFLTFPRRDVNVDEQLIAQRGRYLLLRRISGAATVAI